MRYAFPELDFQIRATIEEYGGAVFPKLNFSSPKVRLNFLFVWGGIMPPPFQRTQYVFFFFKSQQQKRTNNDDIV